MRAIIFTTLAQEAVTTSLACVTVHAQATILVTTDAPLRHASPSTFFLAVLTFGCEASTTVIIVQVAASTIDAECAIFAVGSVAFVAAGGGLGHTIVYLTGEFVAVAGGLAEVQEGAGVEGLRAEAALELARLGGFGESEARKEYQRETHGVISFDMLGP